jgi:hypothetical protein
VGAKATAIRSKVGGRWLKTIVRRRPIFPAIRTAEWKESACKIPLAKKVMAGVCAEAS